MKNIYIYIYIYFDYKVCCLDFFIVCPRTVHCPLLTSLKVPIFNWKTICLVCG